MFQMESEMGVKFVGFLSGSSQGFYIFCLFLVFYSFMEEVRTTTSGGHGGHSQGLGRPPNRR